LRPSPQSEPDPLAQAPLHMSGQAADSVRSGHPELPIARSLPM